MPMNTKNPTRKFRQKQRDYYDKVAAALGYIDEHLTEQPDLATIAKAVGVSPYHFQKIFSEWAGVSPKKYLQFLSLNYAKTLLPNQNLADTAYDVGLSGTGRLHELFVNIEGMTPGEYKNGGENLAINYHFAATHFGDIFVASTAKGVCHLTFADTRETALAELQQRFPNAYFIEQSDKFQHAALSVFHCNWQDLSQVKLHLKGTAFQLNVWNALLKIPNGRLSTYGVLAKQLDNPNACRAVGTAIGKNPVAFLIPCHRVIQSSGHIGQYRWDNVRKKAIIGWEAAQTA